VVYPRLVQSVRSRTATAPAPPGWEGSGDLALGSGAAELPGLAIAELPVPTYLHIPTNLWVAPVWRCQLKSLPPEAQGLLSLIFAV